jgi:hypothetical protein
MPEGVQYPDIIDKVIQEKDGSAALVMREDRPWDGSEGRLAELRTKINTYAAYARHGQLATDFPGLAGKPVSLELWCIQHRPDQRLMEFLDRANAQLAPHSLQIRVRVIEVVTPEIRRKERRHGRGKPWWKIW